MSNLIELSASVQTALRNLAKYTDDLYSDRSEKYLSSNRKGKIPKSISPKTQERYDKLIEALPSGIYTNIKQVLSIVSATKKRNTATSITHSPLVMTYPEFKPCKIMKYQKGHIITGRDAEIEEILLTLCKSSKRGSILVGPPGTGKAQPIDSIVLTTQGWVKIKDLKLGMSVVCPDNTTSKILGVFPQGKKQVNEITFSDGRKTECCDEHLWKVYSDGWKNAGDSYRISETKLLKRIKNSTVDRLYIDLVQRIEQNTTPLEIDPYILGVLIGDGALTKGPQFTKKDEEIINRIRSKLDKDHTLNKAPDKDTFTLSIVSNSNNLYSNKYRNFIRNVGLNVTSENKYIPNIYLSSSIESRIELLKGLLDTDGTVGKGGHLNYNTSSSMLADNVAYLVRSLGGIAKISSKIPTFTYKDKKKKGLKAYRVSIRIPDPKKYVSLKRKKDRLPEHYQYNDLKLEIKNIVEVEEKECACIYIDHPDHLYITNDFIVTHNTAVVNAINARLIERTVPRQLIGANILNMDVPYIFTKYKEDPIGVIIKILERASTYDKAILFIDEVHQLLGHKMNDIMKPYLTEKIRFIGSTTVNEYHAIITEDVALERRFTLIKIEEPNITQTIKMIQGTKSVIEQEHKCTIPDDICEYTVKNGSRFLGHRKNPDKSLDLLDVACAIMDSKEVRPVMTEYKATNNVFDDLEKHKKEITSMDITPGDRTLTEKYVNLAIASATNIPYDEIQNSLNYKAVVDTMSEKIYGQDKGIKELANVVNIFKHTKSERCRPISVLILAGPAGCGKKTAAQLLARTVFGSDNRYIEFDMSGMTSEFMITELKGAPPGYVGYGKSGGLIKKIRDNPQSVVFFRGTHTANETIRQYLIDCSRKGSITDSAEREASLNNTIILHSVTLSDSETTDVFSTKSKATMGFGKSTGDDKNNERLGYNEEALKKIVGEELYRSVDGAIVFNRLDDKILKKVFEVNLPQYLDMYDVDIDRKVLESAVLNGARNGTEVISRLASEVPKQVFNTLKE